MAIGRNGGHHPSLIANPEDLLNFLLSCYHASRALVPHGNSLHYYSKRPLAPRALGAFLLFSPFYVFHVSSCLKFLLCPSALFSTCPMYFVTSSYINNI